MKIIKKIGSISITSIFVFLFFILISNNSVQANDDTYLQYKKIHSYTSSLEVMT